jgi:hypothetical protein
MIPEKRSIPFRPTLAYGVSYTELIIHSPFSTIQPTELNRFKRAHVVHLQATVNLRPQKIHKGWVL